MDVSLLYQLFLKAKGVSTDSRLPVKNTIFFALQGPNFDGSQFIDQVLEAGANFVITSNVTWKGQKKIAIVDDVLIALQELANYHRKSLDIPVLAITGSNGKTTTKELVSRVLGEKFTVHTTRGNFNNLLGLPLTILRARPSDELMVLEMGSNGFGEIEKLCAIADPDFGLITNIGAAHLAGFEDLSGVLQEKTALYRHVVKKDGLLFIPNASGELLLAANSIRKKVCYKVGVEAVNYGETIQIKFDQVVPSISGAFSSSNELITFQSHLIGDHNAENCAAAIAIGLTFNVPPARIARALAKYLPSNNRSQIIKSGKLTVILDAYNANPVSMAKALDTLDVWPSEHKMVILGDMKELGGVSDDAHTKMVERVMSQSYEHAFFVGSEFKKCTEHAFDCVDALGERLLQTSFEFNEGVVLVKGSRSIGLEKILPALTIHLEQVQ